MGTQKTLPPSVIHSVKGLPKHSCWDAVCVSAALVPSRQRMEPSIYYAPLSIDGIFHTQQPEHLSIMLF